MLEEGKLEEALKVAVEYNAAKLVLEGTVNPLYIYITVVYRDDITEEVTCFWDDSVKGKFITRHALVIDSIVDQLKGYTNYVLIPSDFPMTLFWITNDVITYRIIITDTPIEGL